MSELTSSQVEIRDILLKDYELARADMQFYLEKGLYSLLGGLALVLLLSLKGELYMWSPIIIAGIISLISIIQIYIIKLDGYLRLIEQKTAFIYGTASLKKEYKGAHIYQQLDPLIWGYYTDLVEGYKPTRQVVLFIWPSLICFIVMLLAMGLSIKLGISEFQKIGFYAVRIYVFISLLVPSLAFLGFILLNMHYRKATFLTNKELFRRYQQTESVENAGLPSS